jgi:hypothetical protein
MPECTRRSGLNADLRVAAQATCTLAAGCRVTRGIDAISNVLDTTCQGIVQIDVKAFSSNKFQRCSRQLVKYFLTVCNRVSGVYKYIGEGIVRSISTGG